jgi:hypothetical protein
LVSIRRKRFLFAIPVYKFGLQSVLPFEQGTYTRKQSGQGGEKHFDI